MREFNQLVCEQMKIMDQWLHLQDELKRCKNIESKIQLEDDQSDKINIQLEMIELKKELKKIEQSFYLLTEKVIHRYEKLAVSKQVACQ